MKKMMFKIKKIAILLTVLSYGTVALSQQEIKAKKLLDEVSLKMTSYEDIQLDFSTSLINEEVGISENDEPPNFGKIILKGEKYNLNYLGNNFIFDGKQLFIINHDDKEISINDDYLNEDEDFIYPSKLLTFYENGYNYSMGNLVINNGKKIQYVVLIPIDSDSEILEVQLGIDLKTKHIYQLIQLGVNETKTILTIRQFKSNLNTTNELFQLDKEAYQKQGYLID